MIIYLVSLNPSFSYNLNKTFQVIIIVKDNNIFENRMRFAMSENFVLVISCFSCNNYICTINSCKFACEKAVLFLGKKFICVYVSM